MLTGTPHLSADHIILGLVATVTKVIQTARGFPGVINPKRYFSVKMSHRSYLLLPCGSNEEPVKDKVVFFKVKKKLNTTVKLKSYAHTSRRTSCTLFFINSACY